MFADGYYVGIVNDFDGVFQHVNLEAGEHHIEIEAPGFEPVAFDVLVQPGRTITFRADMDRVLTVVGSRGSRVLEVPRVQGSRVHGVQGFSVRKGSMLESPDQLEPLELRTLNLLNL